VIVPTIGVAGVTGCALMTTFIEEAELHPAPLVTVKLYMPGNKPDTMVIGPVPVIPPG